MSETLILHSIHMLCFDEYSLCLCSFSSYTIGWENYLPPVHILHSFVKGPLTIEYVWFYCYVLILHTIFCSMSLCVRFYVNITFFKYLFTFLCVWMFCLLVCVTYTTCIQCLQRSKKGIVSSGTTITGRYYLPCGG